MKLQLLCLATALALGTGMSSHAKSADEEKDYKSYPHMFIGLHGGAQSMFTDYSFGKLITPVYGVSFGGYFNPVVGARLHVSGLETKGGIKSLDATYDYKYVLSNLDLMLNLTNIFSANKDRLFNVILLGGVGLNYAWDNDDFNALTTGLSGVYPFAWEDDRLSHNVRVGMMLDFNIAKHFGMNVELGANNTSDRYNSKTSNSNDWSAYATVGLAFKFGFKNKEKPAPVEEEEVWATRTDTIWYDDVTYKEVPVMESYEENFYYQLRMTDPEPASKVQSIAKFVREHKDCKVEVVGYADKGTGTPKVNMGYSKERAENVVAALVEAGVDEGIITFSYKGDTEQPFDENDKNRLAIVKVTGEGVKKEEVKTRKYRLEETRYRVK